jgi:hypothetical protein
MMQALKRQILNICILVNVFIAAGCSLLGVQAPDSQEITVTVEVARTQSAQTVRAQMTEAAGRATPTARTISATPTETLTPQPPTVTPTLTATVTDTATTTVLQSPTLTPTDAFTRTPTITATWVRPTRTEVPPPYQCIIISKSPLANTYMRPGEEFDGNWTLQNTGSEIWYLTEVLARYRNGSAMHKADAYNIAHNVNPLETISVTTDMIAPDFPGTYTAVWTLSRMGSDFCWFSVNIVVY